MQLESSSIIEWLCRAFWPEVCWPGNWLEKMFSAYRKYQFVDHNGTRIIYPTPPPPPLGGNGQCANIWPSSLFDFKAKCGNTAKLAIFRPKAKKKKKRKKNTNSFPFPCQQHVQLQNTKRAIKGNMARTPTTT